MVFVWLQVRCWEVQDNGQTVPKAQQMHTGPVLDVCWSDVRSPLGFVSEHYFICCERKPAMYAFMFL